MDQIRERAAELDADAQKGIREVVARTVQTKRRVAWITTGSAVTLGLGLLTLYLFTRHNVVALARAREHASHLLAGERAAHSEAAQANRLKDEFLALVSHELRTPLNAILGWISLLKDGANDAKEMSEGLETIDRNARAQSRLIEDLLDVSRIISGKVRLEIREVNLRAVTASVIDALRPAADARGVRVQLLATNEASDVLGDADRLQQVVWNLLSNAIKFTPRGGEVRLSLEHTESRVALTVADTGRGIAPDFLPQVFKRFAQDDGSTTRAHGGLGLGLAITRHLVELHGGKITVQSEGEGRGATFRVEIPVVAVKELRRNLAARIDAMHSVLPERGESARVSLDGRRVLAVDDQPDTLAVIERVLTRAGAEVRTATSAAEGLSILSDWRADLVISDVGMPGQDGYSFIRAVRSQFPNSLKRVPAVALTAFARESDRKAALDAGFSDHLAKPVDASMLLGKISTLLAAR
jgi:signal transduction histidine kinase/ActR/RegA family two-component response regulator